MTRALLASLFAIMGMAAFLVLYLSYALPRVSRPLDINVSGTPEQVERGRYLVEHVLLCMDCHAERDWSKYGGPTMQPYGAGGKCVSRQSDLTGILRVRRGFSGVRISPEENFPDLLCVPNITPDPENGLGEWTDGEIIRAIREGINKDGQAMFPVMPYFIYKRITDDDIFAVVAYLRTLEPIATEPLPRDIQFPLNFLVQTWPRPAARWNTIPEPEEERRYGAYLANVGRCEYCHTPRWGQGLDGSAERKFGGGVPFRARDQLLVSSNLTAHPSGIGDWSREEFIARFRQHGTKAGDEQAITWMNWSAYAGMTDDDIGAIYEHLLTWPPLESLSLER